MRKVPFPYIAWFACHLAACSGGNPGAGADTVSAAGSAGVVGAGGGAGANSGAVTGDLAGTAGGNPAATPMGGTSATGGTLSGGSGGASSGASNGAGTGGATPGGGNDAGGGGAGSPSAGGTATAGAAGATPSGGTGGGGGLAGGSNGGTEPCVVDHGDEVPSLHEYYADHFAMGVAIDSQYSSRSALITKHYNSITAENEMKFDSLEPSEGSFSYGTADGMVNFATSNGMQVRGHALVWHRQTPSWVYAGSSAQVLQRMKNHISNVMQHFQGKVQIWDVVNEAILDDGSFRTNNEPAGQESGWYGALGESYIAEAFLAAREADPDARLFYNDYYNYHPVRRQAIYDMLSGLLDDGVPVDGVGLQAHLNLAPGTDPEEQSYHQSVENLETAIEMYSSLGLEVQVTEMDISLYLRGITYTSDMFYTDNTVTAEVKAEQAERYREFFDMFRRHSDVISSVTTWGITDDDTWLSEFDSGRQDYPLLFDAQGQPKPAFWAVVDFCQ